MRTILHPDYWAEIPEGECLVGLSDEQRLFLWRMYCEQAGYTTASPDVQAQMDAVVNKLRHGEQVSMAESELVFGIAMPDTFKYIRPQQGIWLKRFYIVRFPVTVDQMWRFEHGTSIYRLPGALDEPEEEGSFYRCAAAVQLDNALTFCRALGGRLPTEDEWEKAARGTDGRLYPWGNEWDETRGFFLYGHRAQKPCADGKPAVDAYPDGVSPYGVWGMAGGLPELVVESAIEGHSFREPNGEKVRITLKGYHSKETTQHSLFKYHLTARTGFGDWVALRPVLDQWPQTQWQGVEVMEKGEDK